MYALGRCPVEIHIPYLVPNFWIVDNKFSRSISTYLTPVSMPSITVKFPICSLLKTAPKPIMGAHRRV